MSRVILHICASLIVWACYIIPASRADDNASGYVPPDSFRQPFVIKVGQVENAMVGGHVYLPVIKSRGSEEIWGFDFQLSYDYHALYFMGATANTKVFGSPGEYEWEYFTYRNEYAGDKYLFPSGLMRFVGIADQNDGLHHPISRLLQDNTALFTIDFFISIDWTLECLTLPIRFFWKDCHDNRISFRYRDGYQYDIKDALSKNIFDYDGRNITEINPRFPTYGGSADSCLYPHRGARIFNGLIFIMDI